MNKVLLTGNLGRDPQIYDDKEDSKPMAVLSMATNEFVGSGDDRKKFTEWHRVVVFGAIVAAIKKYYKKGKSVEVEGRLRTRKWADAEGITRWTTEIVSRSIRLLGSAPQSDAQPPVPPMDAEPADDPIPF